MCTGQVGQGPAGTVPATKNMNGALMENPYTLWSQHSPPALSLINIFLLFRFFFFLFDKKERILTSYSTKGFG